uniref:B-type lysozyme n=1 Tax=Plautia stali TaxID=106108 RepID=A0A499U664_PLAST|nr:B-type lysozyme [Plautia stali]
MIFAFSKMFKFILLLCFGMIWATNGEISNVVIDLSHWNNVNFTKAKADGIVAVVHKATQGARGVDETYATRRILAENEGLLWGAYHFGTKGTPVKQADHFLATVGDTKGVLLMLDVEENKGKEMSPSEAEEFVKRIKEKTGRYPIIYGNRYFLRPYHLENLNECPLWISHYTSASQPTLPSQRSSWTLWQYTDGKLGGSPKTVNGIGPCDRDRYNGSIQQLKNRWPNL